MNALCQKPLKKPPLKHRGTEFCSNSRCKLKINAEGLIPYFLIQLCSRARTVRILHQKSNATQQKMKKRRRTLELRLGGGKKNSEGNRLASPAALGSKVENGGEATPRILCESIRPVTSRQLIEQSLRSNHYAVINKKGQVLGKQNREHGCRLVILISKKSLIVTWREECIQIIYKKSTFHEHFKVKFLPVLDSFFPTYLASAAQRTVANFLHLLLATRSEFDFGQIQFDRSLQEKLNS